ncbi:hypothetical protein [Pararhizobium haloflavum]|uniref:hypothetical protein n=1 Tax=Pararhizobium haloflavum TaxID=2037914 RepID=UPI000C178AD8|nr:hypothetical protein [Pararhizobium haloflavum]
MALQNRVDPFGMIHASPARGMFMGNRGGRIHEPDSRRLTARRWASKAWIICLLDFHGRSRTVMGPTGYTELFFLDEATALAAGHRPCFECQRTRAKAFADAFRSGNDLDGALAGQIDSRLHCERTAAGHEPAAIDARAAEKLPDGSMIGCERETYLVIGGRFRRWSFHGYDDADVRPTGLTVMLTPPSTVAALRAGYHPALHETAVVS